MGMHLRKNLTIYSGRAGDRNTRAMAGAVKLGTDIARRFGASVNMVGVAGPVINGGWKIQLSEALPSLKMLADNLANRLDVDATAVTVTGRCAASLATLPVVARRHPDAVIVWFDAHGDCNAPTDSTLSESAYLGGMVLTGAAGEWDSGLGGELHMSNVVLVGSRALDAPEWEKIRAGTIRLIKTGDHIGERLLAAVNNNPVYVHLDCDVLATGLVPTEYQEPGGLSYQDLEEALIVISQRQLIGLEISEFEETWPDGQPGNPDRLIEAIDPLLQLLFFRGVKCK